MTSTEYFLKDFQTKLTIHHEIDLNEIDHANIDASYDEDAILELPDVPIAVKAGYESDDSVETDAESVDISQFIQSSGRIKDSFQ